ncbi:TMCO4 family protein [Aldersonia sp. NBC_00410]|uniref:DUF726 domain-containing protein n=1 Tax=Aldersonia sp. NBC_00410 TaxID=2975954 RepID=UPI002251DA49|nr:DUF726 domain-containing protein [Aldersonia sp. NBC_00410]MCX5042430.1 TMCO4 family protein [Aldersonia sp. NBC_00410]
MSATIEYTDSPFGMVAEIRSPRGLRLRVSGDLNTIEPKKYGDPLMRHNPALVHNTWAYAKHEKQARKYLLKEKKASHQKQAEVHAKAAKGVASLIDCLVTGSREGWCSGCYTFTDHQKVDQGAVSVATYMCTTCGSPTLKCAAPRCSHMATRGFGSIRIPRFCAEHRHELPSFERAQRKVDSLNDYQSLHVFEKRNLSRGSRLALAGAALAGAAATAGVLAAPAVGGAIGVLAGYSGAAASSYGLAFLGGGAIAAGGFGMVGGTFVVAATGAALGSALGVSVTNAYISEDKSFRIERFRHGSGTPVIIARGFLTQSNQNWNTAVQLVDRRYPDSPIYLLHWGSKELTSLAAFVAKNIGVKEAAGAGAMVAAQAGKAAAKKLMPLAPALFAADVAKNPWHTAVVRADRTGVALAGILAHTQCDKYVLVGHSLGGRAMITAAETLATSRVAPSIETVHLLGTAEGKKQDWRPLSESVIDAVHNYYSTNDAVLKILYAVAQAGSVAVGLRGFTTEFSAIKDHDVSDRVNGHSEYFEKVNLC